MIDPHAPQAYLRGMEWQGLDISSETCWNEGGECAPQVLSPERTLIVGEPSVPADTIPGTLLPEQLPRDPRGLHLPALGAIDAASRLRLLGFQTLNPRWDGIAVVAGAERTLWATISAGEVIHLQISLTGQLATALACKEADPVDLDAAMGRAERLPFQLGSARTSGERLAALLGAEMAAAKSLWLGQQAVLIGKGALAQAYLKALRGLYVPVTETMETAVIREGFRALARKFVLAE